MDVTPSPLSTSALSTSPNKRTHKAPKIKTEDYHDKVIKKRRIVNKNNTIKPSSSKKSSQSTIVNFLSPSIKQSTLKEEEYFVVPSNLDGFNLLSLRRHVYSIKTKPNVIALIKKVLFIITLIHPLKSHHL